MCANFQATSLAQICPKMDQDPIQSWGRNFKNLSLHSRSAPSIYHVCQFSVTMDSFKFFRLHFCPITCNILVLITLRVLKRAEWRLKWAGWEWMEVDGAGWRWVNGLLIPNFAYKKTCSTVKWRYLSCHSSSWFRRKWRSSQIRQYIEIVLLHPSTPWRFRECSYRSLFLFYTACHNQNIVQRKTEFCISSYFHRTFIGFKLPI